jgi:hypothetical protein
VIRKVQVFIFFVFICNCFPVSAGSVRGFGSSGLNPCATGSQGVLEEHQGTCRWKNATLGYERAKVRWGVGQVFSPIETMAYANGFENGYVMYTGTYFVRMHLCPATTEGLCSIKNSVQRFDSVRAEKLNATLKVIDQSPDFGGFNGVLNQSSNACYTFVELERPDKEWRSNGEFFCSDAMVLPPEPAECYFNMGQDLNVALGSLERSEIPINANFADHVQKKSVEVLCTREASVTINIQFNYTPLLIGGESIIKSSATGLGIAMRFDGVNVDPTKVFTKTYSSGFSNFDLEFQAVREPSLHSTDLPAGDFTANAIMIATIQ